MDKDNTQRAAPLRRQDMYEEWRGFRPSRRPVLEAGEAGEAEEELPREGAKAKWITRADVKVMRTSDGSTIFEFPFDMPAPKPWIYASELEAMRDGGSTRGRKGFTIALSVIVSGGKTRIEYDDYAVEMPSNDFTALLDDAKAYRDETRASFREYMAKYGRVGSRSKKSGDWDDAPGSEERGDFTHYGGDDAALRGIRDANKRASDARMLANWERSWKG